VYPLPKCFCLICREREDKKKLSLFYECTQKKHLNTEENKKKKQTQNINFRADSPYSANDGTKK
jgi:hypothetical protein